MTALLNAVGQLYFFSFIMVLHTLLQQYSCHSGFKTTNVELKPSWQLYCFSRVLAPWFRRKRSWPTAVVVQSFRFPALLLANFFSCGHILIFSLISLNKVLFVRKRTLFLAKQTYEKWHGTSSEDWPKSARRLRYNYTPGIHKSADAEKITIKLQVTDIYISNFSQMQTF